MELRMRNRVCKECADLHSVPFKGSVAFSALSASVIAISSCIPVQNASLIAEIPFNWTIANTRYGIISVHVVGHFKNQNLQGFNIDRVTTCKI